MADKAAETVGKAAEAAEKAVEKAADKVTKETAKYGYRRDLRGELTSYAVGAALNGMFLYLGEEEKAIRKDPARRTTAILKKVFGAV